MRSSAAVQLLLAAALVSDALAFSPLAPTGLRVQRRDVSMSLRPQHSSSLDVPVLLPKPVRMAREDGGAGKIKPGGGGGGGGVGKDGMEGERGGAGVAVLTKPPDVDKVNDFEKKESVDKEPIWRVLLHNDDVHTFDYVIDTIVKVVRTVTRKKAHRITMEAHKSGLATVTTTWKQLAREYSLGLQKAGLTSSIAPDKSNSC
mmetsp:Transcript_14356/g.22273  ORF Transcript_14356/g.22273 Transcript_14356/m.22273 type:complete len:202 (-) Transcript_14356:989-1594(-)|eukprot:CAMPEP_0184300210 /NCGR_PEP_ID=MMETSP1049-20130417/10674_1 /TAXON_ID=77928 /ORGANISM="Proteomonas sulcata, Strain CCMP704" /LENGTH=201 /DNA_ID=CAMNT_0026610873 /DNA_START=33 /DNA_END=638 /DNA_ORIENTATION=+